MQDKLIYLVESYLVGVVNLGTLDTADLLCYSCSGLK